MYCIMRQIHPPHTSPTIVPRANNSPHTYNILSVFLSPNPSFFPLSQVSNGSVVQFEDRNLSFSCEVRKETLPHGNEHLMSWAKHLYRAITSFTELKMTHDVYIKVGEGVYMCV